MTTQLEQAARLALDALEYENGFHKMKNEKPYASTVDAITALRAALEQPTQKKPQNCGTSYCSCIECVMEQPAQDEPVAWVCYGSSSDEKHAVDYEQHEIDSIPVGTLLYTRPCQCKE